VTIFPHLIAGPVLHHKSMLKQFDQLKTNAMNWSLIAQGIFLFCLGMGKKVMIADYLTQFVTPIFDGTLQEVPFIQAWFGALAYTLQLYFDFSGYSDMAVGLGLIFGLELPTNFNSPYQASSMIDFWHRWHITLSQFLRDYLYIPLGGSRYGYLMKMRNLFITMLLGGMWHGAGWTFIVWGICHGFFLIVNHLWRDAKLSIPYSLARLVTLLAVIITWVIFRSPTMDQAFYILKGMVGLNGIILPEGYAQYFAFLTPWGVKFMHLSASKFHVMDLIFLIALSYIALICANSSVWLHRFQDNPKRWVLPCSGLFFLSFIYLDQLAEFLYYQF
jgi:alginate O-acetyltransferase complex protein AlgI